MVCYKPEVLSATLQLFQARKDSIYATLRAIKELTPARLKEAEDYLDKFYREIEDPQKGRKTFEGPCKK